MSGAKSNYDVFVAAGLIDHDRQRDFSQDDIEAINGLTQGEVAHLVTAGHKLGKDFVEKHAPHAFFF